MKRGLLTFFAAILIIVVVNAQNYESMLGYKAGYKTGVLSAKIPLNAKDALEGNIGVFTPQPDYTVGFNIAYHRAVFLKSDESWQFYYGVNGSGVIGDEESLGAGLSLGIMYIYKRINFGIDAYPTYYFNGNLGLRPLPGLYLRWVN